MNSQTQRTRRLSRARSRGTISATSGSAAIVAAASFFGAAALGCAPSSFTREAAGPADDPASTRRLEVAVQFDSAVDRVEQMVHDRGLQRAAAARGLSVMNLTWEDAGRAQGSALGPNISDLTLQVRRRDARGRMDDALMPVVRYPNFTDKTGDVPADRFFLRVGNEGAGGGELRTESLADVLRDIRKFVSAPQSIRSEASPEAPIDLSSPRDTHYLVSAQAVFLPIPKEGKAEFNPVLFNYQSSPGSPAVLSILATREGTSVAVIENRTEDVTVAGWGQELYFNDHGQRASFTAERRSEVAARIAAQGGPKTEADRSALGKGADVLAIIQVPLRHKNQGLLGGALPTTGDPGYGYDFSSDPLTAGGFGPYDATIRVRPGPVGVYGGDVERAVLGHGAHLGPFFEGAGREGGEGGPAADATELIRDHQFPVRITVQFYKATSDGIATEADIAAIAKNIQSAYEHADFIGSLVLPEGDARRPTAWQTMPREWFPW